MTDLRDRVHRHVVAVYGRDDDLAAAVIEFFSDALNGDGAIAVVATPEHRAVVDAALAAAGHTPEALERAGRYVALDARDTLTSFMNGSQIDPAEFAVAMKSMLGNFATAGPVRLFGEMVALLWDDGNLVAAVELESLWNDLAAHHTFDLLCAYAVSSLETADDLAAAKRMCEQHTRVVPLGEYATSRPQTASRVLRDSYDRLFVGTPSVLRSVRDFVRDVLSAWDEGDPDGTVEVIASELATNAVKHARSPFRVAMTRSGSTLRIAVRDASFDRPEKAGSDSHRLGGRGIQLVATLSRAWGTQDEPDGKTVWAEVLAGRSVEEIR